MDKEHEEEHYTILCKYIYIYIQIVASIGRDFLNVELKEKRKKEKKKKKHGATIRKKGKKGRGRNLTRDSSAKRLYKRYDSATKNRHINYSANDKPN